MNQKLNISFMLNALTGNQHGNIYLPDGNRIRKITPQPLVSTLAGSASGYEDGEAISAKFFSPTGLGIDKRGNVDVANKLRIDR
jgi:hypothetical protein